MAGLISILLSFIQIILTANSVPLSSFYPYGLSNGDYEFPANDDGSTYLDLSTPFVFYGQSYNRVYVNNNGDLSFITGVPAYTSSPFPLSFPIIAPYWADVDTRGTGRVYYRETTSSTIISTLAADISNAFPNQSPFTATGVVIATWYYVGYYKRNTDKTNTFQCILATDGYRSYVIFLYLDNGIQWTTGDASGGSNGFGGTPALVGFNAGDNTTYFAVAGSRTSYIVNIETTSNIGTAGMWVFQVNNDEIESPVEEVSCGLLQVAGGAVGGLSVSLNGTSVYSIANYSCTQDGYLLLGEEIRVCTSNGSWDGSTPSCQLVDCGPLSIPPSHPGGLSLYVSNTVYNSIAQYTCNETGYEINGTSQTVCDTNGNWNGTLPSCKLTDCGVPDTSNDHSDALMITYSNTTYGGLAVYSCDVEYNLIGNSTLTCTENGTWNNDPPFCQIIDCGEITISPGAIGGLIVGYNDTIVYNIAEYNCTNIAYQLIGNSQRVCQLNGTWSGSDPYCELIDCGPPESNYTALSVAYIGTTYGSTATYTCLNGYSLMGDFERICSISGQWSSTSPRCQIIDCGIPDLPDANFSAIILTYKLTTFNSIAKYSCDTGYEMVGQTQRLCMANGEWDGEPPQCQIMHCKELTVDKPEPGSLEVVLFTTTFNSTAFYYCLNYEFNLVGASSRTCGASGEWLGEEPYCATLPMNIMTTVTSSTSVYLSWTVPSNSTNLTNYIDHFVIEIQEVDTSTSWKYLVVNEHALIEFLHPYYTYRCRVAVFTDQLNPFTDFIQFATLEDAPDVSPQNLNVMVLNSQSLNVSWIPPPSEHHNGIIRFYTVEIYTVSNGDVLYVMSNASWAYVDELHPYYTYTIRISASTISQGPYSSPVQVTLPEEAPSSPPTSVFAFSISYDSIQILWQPPEFSNQNGIIREYIVNITEVDTGLLWNLISINNSVIAESLHANYNYSISVRAVTISPGPFSEQIFVLTDENVPSSSPGNFTAVITSPYSANLSWESLPDDLQNGIITGYLINITVLELNEKFQLYSPINELMINSLKPFRTYICIIAAQTSVGTGPFSSQYVLKTPQDAPSGPPIITVVSLVSSHGFRLSWDSPDEDVQNGVIVYYTISVIEIQTNTSTERTSYSNILNVDLLHPAYTYQCKIAAYTVGLGPFSSPINITTAEEAPSGPPNNLMTSSISPYSVTLTWSEPSADQQNGMIVSYLLNITSHQSNEVVSYAPNSTSLHVFGLRPFVYYSCVVAAKTSVGTGPYALILFTTLEAAPASPPCVMSSYSIDSTSVAIIWSPPPSLHQNGVIREYWINVTNVETGKHWLNVSTTTNAVISPLIPSFTYEFEVAAYTVAVGPYSDKINLTMPEDAPKGFPKSITGMSTSPYSIELSWEPPSLTERNGEIIRYVVDVTQTNTLQSTQYFTTSLSLNITDLDPYTTYVYVIAAETTIGAGPFSHLHFIQTPEAAPDSSPESVSGIALSSTSIHITWDPPKVGDHNGIITEYRVNITEARTGNINQLSTNETQMIIKNLKPYHIYHCHIVAVTVEEGPYSKAISVLTDEDAPSAPPQELQVTVISYSSAYLSWDSPPLAFQNGIIRKYQLKITSLSSGESLTFMTNANEINVTTLAPFTIYEAQIAAFTVAIGPYSISSNFTTFEDIPYGPPEQFNASSITPYSLALSWKSPSEIKINGILKHYNITVVEEDTGAIVKAGYVNHTSLILTNLHPFYTYKCTVSAVTIGEGPITSLSIQMPEDAPAVAPKNLTASSITSSSVEISWLELLPENRNGVVRHYVVNVTELNTGTVHTFTSFYDGVTLHSLHPNYEYAIAVAAYTVAEGPFSFNLLLRAKEDKPSSSPLNLQSVSITSSSALFSWNPPPASEQNGVIIGYNISLTSSFTDQMFLLCNTTSTEISMLNPYKVYKIAVAAYTSSGTGPFTAFLIFQTNEDAPTASPVNLSLASKTSTSLSLQWLSPNEMFKNGIIRSYSVKVVEVNTSIVSKYETTSTTIITNGLHPFYGYECSVAAVTIATGPFTTPLTLQTAEDAPNGPPLNIEVDSINSGTLNISWKSPDEDKINGIIRHYIIKMSELETLKEFTYQTAGSPLLIHSLHPFYTYNLIIAAYTVATGPFSEGHNIQMPPDSPSGPPQNFTAEILNSSTARFYWNPPSQNQINGFIYSYQIILYEQETNTSQIIHQSVLQNSLTTTNLHPFYHYTVSVAAYTISLGPSSSIDILTLEDVPSGPPKDPNANVLNSTSVIIEWNPPDLDQQNGVINHYKIAAYKVGNEIDHEVHGISSTSSFILTNLYPYSVYIYEISAVTVGPGPVINGTFQTGQDVPSAAPTDLVSSVVSSNMVLISWSELSSVDRNGIITEYTVSILNINSNEQLYYQASSISLTLGNLSPYTNYKFNVAASTIIGRGPFSIYVHFKTLQAAPSSYPRNVSSMAILSTSFTLTWLPPFSTDQNGIIMSYMISLLEAKTNILMTYNTVATNITISYLSPFSVYNCSVAATTVATGPFSSPISIKTDQTAPSAPPSSITIVAPSHSEFQIFWEPPPDNLINGFIQYYVINITVLNTNENLIYFSNTTPFIESEAHPYYTYNARIAAVTVSVGPFSQDVSVTTPQHVPSGPPQNITCESISSSAVRLSWNPPLAPQQNGQITSYNILVFEIPSNTTKQTLTVSGSDTYAQVISNLHPFYEYRLSVAASTVDVGPYGVSHITTDEDAPSGPPRNLTFMLLNSSSVVLSWTPPLKEHHNGRIQSYLVLFKEIESVTTVNFSITETQLILEDLHPFYIYSFDIAAVTAVASGPFVTKSLQMPEDAPSGPPNKLMATVLNHTSLYISWSPPFSEMQNGIIRNYSVIIKDAQYDMNWRTYYAGKQTKVTVSNLHPFHTYVMRVAAFTIKMGPFSGILEHQLPESTPNSPPLGLHVVFKNSSFNLTWTSPPPSTHNGVLLGYNITCTAQSGHYIVLSQFNGTSVTIQGIQNNTHYTCNVCAYTSVGCGPSVTTHISTYFNSLIGPPSSVRANATTTMIFTEWTPPFDPNFIITGFTLVYQLLETTSIDINTPRPSIKVENITDAAYVLQTLLMNSVYSVYVYAMTVNGPGPSSERVIISTGNQDLSDPQNFKCSSASSDSLLCTWEHPHLNAYIIDSYEVCYRLADGFNYFDADYEKMFAEPETLPSDVQQYRILNLLPYTGCIVEIRVHLINNSQGEESGMSPSDYNEVVGISTTMNISLSQVPLTSVDEMSINLQPPTSVYLSWKPPNKREWRGEIQNFAIFVTAISPIVQHNILFVKPKNNSGDPSLAIEPLQPEEHVIENLEEGFEYMFEISVVNSVGNGPMSNAHLTTIPENIPSKPPRNITAISITESSVYISWEPPDPFDSNGVIIGYSLEYKRKNFNESNEYIIQVSQSQFLKKGLHAFEEVVVQIAAETAIGLGPYSPPYSFFTLEKVPSAPVSLHFNFSLTYGALLTWKPPEQPNGVVKDYQILYYSHRQLKIEREMMIFSTEELQLNVTDYTTPGFFYEFKVRARNSAGFSENATIIASIPANTTAKNDERKSGDSKLIIISVPAICTTTVILVFVFVVVCIVFVRKRNEKKRMNIYDLPMPGKELNIPSTTKIPDVPVLPLRNKTNSHSSSGIEEKMNYGEAKLNQPSATQSTSGAEEVIEVSFL